MTEHDPTCPFCQGRGFTWDYEDYDGFYALCSHCGGSGRLVADGAEVADKAQRIRYDETLVIPRRIATS